MATGRRTIDLMGNAVIKERVAASAFSPGHCVNIDSSGELEKHNNAGGPGMVAIALPNSLEGQGVTDAYATDDTAKYAVFGQGDECLVRIKDGENIAIGDYLVHGGSGLFKEHVPDSSGAVVEEIVKVQALEACDMSSSAGGDADGFCRVVVVG